LAAPTTVLTFLSTGNPTGLKFTVERAGTRAIFDFGLEHAPGRAPFSLGLEPRPGRELADLIAVGSAPRLEGVYEAWDGRTSLFLSHMHLDHTSLVPFVHPEVPLFYPEAMEGLRSAADRTGYLPWRQGPPGNPAGNRERVRVGEIEVEFVAVDHDLPGATGFLIRAPDLTIAYTGDHRWHGLHAEVTAAYAAAARGFDVLIQEGVLLGFDRPRAEGEAAPLRRTEAEVHAAFDALVEGVAGLLVVNLYPMNRERVNAFARSCAARGRRFLMEPVSAALAGWRDVLGDLDAIRFNPERYCVQLPYAQLPLLIDLEPPPGSVFVQSDGPPIGEYDPAWGVLNAWTQALGLVLTRISSSGHSRPADIVRMVESVGPGVVLPVHTQTPEALAVAGIPRLLPAANRPYDAGELKAIR
jgi:ribonuclease J